MQTDTSQQENAQLCCKPRWFGGTANSQAGLTLVDTLVGIAIAITLLAAVFGMFQMSLRILFDAGARSQATALAEQRMEYIRSLPYRKVGTQGGIPDGILQEEEEITRNEITYTRRTFVQYYDDPEDGTGDDDANNVVQDYKRAKVAVSWPDGESTKTVESASFIVPNGIESSTGGGTLSISVFDATGDPVRDAQVQIDNPSTSPKIDTETYTNASGTTRFSGAPASSNYQITVTKPGYSKAQTYDKTNTNVAPDPGHLTVASSSITSASFPIDVLSDVTLHTLTPIRSASWTEPITEATKFAKQDDTIEDDGDLTLAKNGNAYATSGYAYTLEFGTSTVRQWEQLKFTASTSDKTSAVFHMAAKTDTGYERLSNNQLAGNESGFENSPVSLAEIATSTYDQLAVEIQLQTKKANETPKVARLSVSYQAGRMSKPSIGLQLHGEKIIGERADGSKIYKHAFATSTDQSGRRLLTEMEWDTYHTRTQSTSTRRIAAACPQEPYPLSPATSTSLDLVIADTGKQPPHSLRVDVNANGEPVSGATTTIRRPGVRAVKRTYSCGQSFFTGLENHDDYKLKVTAESYPTVRVNNLSPASRRVISVDLTN